MDLVRAIADLDQADELDAARLLLLLDAFSEGRASEAIEGLTKLAKLDFLLRYPVMLERALTAKGKSTREVAIDDHERFSVESEMVRYRFGPWDHRYRERLNGLVARGLVSIAIAGRTVNISVTELGKTQARALASETLFEPYACRVRGCSGAT